MPSSVDIPHAYPQNSVVYTGTHDNNTTTGWFRNESTKEDRKRLEDYIGYRVNEKNIASALMRLAYSSVANMAIVPMQDILGLDEHARMNMPGSTNRNWLWRMTPEQISGKLEKQLKKWTYLYNRQ